MSSKTPNPPPSGPRDYGPKVASPPPPPKKGSRTVQVASNDSGSDALNCLRIVSECYRIPIAIMPSDIDGESRWQVVRLDGESAIIGFGGTAMAAVLDAHKTLDWERKQRDGKTP